MRRLKHLIHPLLFAAFPVLFLFQHNRAEVTWGQVWMPLLASVAFAVALLLIGSLLFWGNLLRAGLAATAGVILFFSYGHVREAVSGYSWGRTRYVFPAWFLLGVVALYTVIRAKPGSLAPRLLNTMGAVLVVLALGGVVVGGGATSDASPAELRADDVRLTKPEQPRDVWYLVFDRYASNRSLKEVFGYDNSPFLNALRDRGFYIAEDARANYVNTLQSMASSLNLDYLDEMTRGARGNTWSRVRQLVQEHEVGRALKAIGYHYFHIGSWSEISRLNATADTIYQHDDTPEFTKVLWDTTMLRLIDQKGGADGAIGRRAEHRAIPPFQFRKLNELAGARGPKFVMAHILLPHRPYVFDAEGGPVSKAQEDQRGVRQAYVDQMRWTNDQILGLVDHLVAAPEERRPIVIIAADEGPYPARWQELKYADRTGVRDKNPAELRLKFQILQALLLPGVDPAQAGLRPSLSPVNQFRVVFNTYFGADLPLLPDRSFIFPSGDRRYDFVDVTDEFDDDGGNAPPIDPA